MRLGASALHNEDSAQIRHSRRLAQLLLMPGHRGFAVQREFVMSRFENFAFSVGIMLAGVLSLAAVPLV